MVLTMGVVALGPVTWGLLAVGVVLAVVVAGLVWAWLTGRLTLDLGWGRSVHPLGPLEVTVEAPKEVVYEVVASPYLGRTPRKLRSELEVLEQGTDLVVAAHHTGLSWLTSTTVESVRFDRPERISFRLLRGVAPSVTEEFRFEETDGGTGFSYRGELAMDFWSLGRTAGRRLVAPTWERAVRRHMQRVKEIAEGRGNGRRRA
jgi:hypothetical protein